MIPLPNTFFGGINENRWLFLWLFLQGDRNSMMTALRVRLLYAGKLSLMQKNQMSRGRM